MKFIFPNRHHFLKFYFINFLKCFWERETFLRVFRGHDLSIFIKVDLVTLKFYNMILHSFTFLICFFFSILSFSPLFLLFSCVPLQYSLPFWSLAYPSFFIHSLSLSLSGFSSKVFSICKIKHTYTCSQHPKDINYMPVISPKYLLFYNQWYFISVNNGTFSFSKFTFLCILSQGKIDLFNILNKNIFMMFVLWWNHFLFFYLFI